MRRIGLSLSLLCAVMLGLMPTQVAQAQSPYAVEVNGQPVPTAHPYMEDGQLMARASALAAAMGLRVHWDDGDLRLDLAGRGHQAAFWTGSQMVYRDGKRYWAPAEAEVRSGWVYLPVWFTGKLFQYQVAWDGTTMRLTRTGSGTGPGTGEEARSHPLLSPAFVFPFPAGARYEPYMDDYGETRVWTPEGEQVRRHEGIDIRANKGTPLVSVADGTIVRIGWNQYGGWRLQIRPDAAPDYRIYYAHLNGYGPDLYNGARVRAGQVVGYVGSTGYGPEGTEGKFVSHLHLGIYLPDGSTINPYSFLRNWESRRVAPR